MTQPYPQQPYQPPQYATQPQTYAAPPPQQPQYGAPQGTPWLPPQYGGQPAPQQQPTGPVGGQAMPTAAPALGQSARTGGDGPKAPAPRHLVGRTVIFEPVRIDETTTIQRKNALGVMETVSAPTAHYHLTVVDGGPLQYGDNRDHDISKQHGMTFEVQTPARFTSVSSDRFGIVNEVRDAMARGDMASVGVIVQGTRGNRPFLVTKPGRDLDGNDRPDGAERFERATLVWNDIFAKRFVSPEPRSLVAAPPSTPPQVQYQPQPVAAYPPQGYPMPQEQAAAYVAQIPAAQPAYGQPGQYGYPAAPNETMTAYNPGPAPQQPAYGQTMAPWGQAYQPPQSAPPAQPDGPGVQMLQQALNMPANPAFEAYIASLPPEQQAAARAQFAPQAQPQQPAGPGF